MGGHSIKLWPWTASCSTSCSHGWTLHQNMTLNSLLLNIMFSWVDTPSKCDLEQPPAQYHVLMGGHSIKMWPWTASCLTSCSHGWTLHQNVTLNSLLLNIMFSSVSLWFCLLKGIGSILFLNNGFKNICRKNYENHLKSNNYEVCTAVALCFSNNVRRYDPWKYKFVFRQK
jgi:hypothetical protein